MAIYDLVAKQFSRYLSPTERILATISCESILGLEKVRACITTERMCFLVKSGLFSWDFGANSLAELRNCNVIVKGKFLKSTISISNGEGKIAILPDVDNKDASDFVSALRYGITQDFSDESQRTKVCLQCDEIVKFRAIRCRYCGFDFNDLTS